MSSSERTHRAARVCTLSANWLFAGGGVAWSGEAMRGVCKGDLERAEGGAMH